MAQNPTPSLLDSGQIIKRAFDESEDRIRVDAEVTATIGSVEVVISDTEDSIKIGDGSGNYVDVVGGELLVHDQDTQDKLDIGNASVASIDSKVSTAAKQDTGNTSLSSIDSKASTTNTSLSSIDSKASTTNTSLSSLETRVGATNESVAASDTSTSGLNGLIKRLAQHLTSILTLLGDGNQKTQVVRTTGTVKQAAITVGTTAVRLTTDGNAPSSTRASLVATPDLNSIAIFYVGSSTVTSSGATRGVPLVAGEQFIANDDAGNYYIISDTAAQTVFVVEQE